MTGIPERLKELLQSVEPEAEVTVEGDEDGWVVSVELDHFEFLGEEHAEGRRLHVVVSGSSGNVNDAAAEASTRLEEVLSGAAEDYHRGGPPIG